MGSVLRTWGSSAPAAERRGPSARPGAALTLLSLLLWHNTHSHARIRTQNKQSAFQRWSFSSPRASRRRSVLFIYIVCEPDSQPRRTNCVSARRARTSSAGENTPKHSRKDSRPVANPPVFWFPVSFFFLRFISCCLTRNPGLSPCSEDERKLDSRSRLWGCFTGFISLWRKRDPGAERCAKSRGLPPLFSPLPPSISPSINLSAYPLLSIYLSVCFHVFRSVRFC